MSNTFKMKSFGPEFKSTTSGKVGAMDIFGRVHGAHMAGLDVEAAPALATSTPKQQMRFG